VFGLTFGELFILTFITVSVVSAPLWPQLGEWLEGVLRGPSED
jgi:hypothetical protein